MCNTTPRPPGWQEAIDKAVNAASPPDKALAEHVAALIAPALTKHLSAQSVSTGVTLQEFADLNHVSLSCIRTAVASGEIPSYKIGKVRRIPLAYLKKLQRGDIPQPRPKQVPPRWPGRKPAARKATAARGRR